MTRDLAPVLALLRREIPGLAGVYLFGSAAYGAARAESDVDLAFFAGPPLARGEVVRLQMALADLLRRDVDLVDLASATTILQAQVLGEGRLIDAPDAPVIAAFEVRAMRAYQELKARRADLEAAIAARGRVYAG